MKRAPAIVAVAAAFAALAVPAASASTFSGSCKFSGTITPEPPITVLPRPGPHFEYAGSGVCGGRPATLTFAHASTPFDTCELGPDFPLHGAIVIGAARFAVTVDLARLALLGPLLVTTSGGGLAVGAASFNPGNQLAAVENCLGPGVGTASLAANFSTLRPLVGT